MLSFAIPGTVIGISYILAFNMPPIELTGTATDHGDRLRVPEHAGRHPRRARQPQPDRPQPRRGVADARRRRPARRVRRVVLPILRPAVATAMVYAFVRAITSVSAVIFLVSGEYNLATVYIVGRAEFGEYGLAIVYSAVLIVIMVAGRCSASRPLVGERRIGRRLGRPGMPKPGQHDARHDTGAAQMLRRRRPREFAPSPSATGRSPPWTTSASPSRPARWSRCSAPPAAARPRTLRLIAGLEQPSDGQHPDRRRGRDPALRRRARRQHGVPVLRAVSAHDA